MTGSPGSCTRPMISTGWQRAESPCWTDPVRHQSIAEAALAAVLQRFCSKVVVPRYEAFYRQVIEREPGPGFTPVIGTSLCSRYT